MTGQFLYRIRPTRPAMLTEGPTPRESEIVAQHFAYLQNLAQQGIVFLAGRTQTTDDPEGMGIVIFQADSEAAARAVVDNDPAVKNGVFSARLFPYQIALWSAPPTE